ncbi:septal ring lytic transglycosylase RlpA family lipoprotein [Paramagnetospirillum kuznetsovii]|uniref:Endolytic peptidoglycan transglycosylase RlpA n=1 Tax=Paramagnetospirillum kuznetsovii TaxID=2053833 RepID=A0A364NSR9_9PROT|nr:septal ring lytic transglycosylase RlpA family protein [Paramagnetospirillum kuznetsovii]RAU20129.1 septal ring lytic transglycosylase RlpA family lipoprotein [Paramagnetospirillum kuznetsovii]
MKAIKAAAIAAMLVVVGSSPVRADAQLGRESFGTASWYGPGFKGQRTANGEKFNPKALTAAHPSLPFGTLVEVSRPDRKKSVVVVITDRGPFTGRAIDLSQAAARRLHMTYLGAVPVKMQVVGYTE